MILDSLESAGQTQLTLFEAGSVSEKRNKLMAELDALYRRFGKGTVKRASLLLPSPQLRAP